MLKLPEYPQTFHMFCTACTRIAQLTNLVLLVCLVKTMFLGSFCLFSVWMLFFVPFVNVSEFAWECYSSLSLTFLSECFSQVIDMPEHNPGQMGGTMRLGKRRTLFQTKNSIMSKAFLTSFGSVSWEWYACMGGMGKWDLGMLKHPWMVGVRRLCSGSQMEINEFGPL